MDLALSTAFVLFVLAIPVVFTGGVLLFLYASSVLAGGAKQALTVLADNEYRQALLFLADYAVERRY